MILTIALAGCLQKQQQQKTTFGPYHLGHLHGLIKVYTVYSVSVAELDARPAGDQDFVGWTLLGRQHSLWRFNHEMFSTVILSLVLI